MWWNIFSIFMRKENYSKRQPVGISDKFNNFDFAEIQAMHASTTDAKYIKALLKPALTDKIDDRELFMKGIDYSYYYEQEK